ncbi:MAG: UDP-N-acetylmuramate--L-alanine ligase, partial [Bacteroidales bacterium]|nr:UDP-N-acetylmuramate--L-alanine ligase [Bacteroidales bacterium]
MEIFKKKMAEKSIYFIGIGGIGMSAIARYYKFLGCEVSGYDRTPSDLTAELEAEGIAVHYEDRPDLVPKDVDLVVWTPAIPADLEELKYVRENGCRLVKRSEILGEISRGQTCLAVAGTHGKTTTSTLLAHIFTSCGVGCTAFLGGVSKNYGTNFLFARNKVLVAEADEFDRSFLQLHPEIAAITSVDADHLDIYSDIENVRSAFRAFAGQVSGTVLLKYGVEMGLEEEKSEIGRRHSGEASKDGCPKILTYSLDDPRADFHASDISRDECGCFSFALHHCGEVAEGLHCGVPGMVNVENSVAAAAIALVHGLSVEQIRPALASFAGVKRRFDIHYNSPTLTYLDDYAHHPRELSATLAAIRGVFPGRKVTVVFQPHLYTRTRDFAEGFAEALSKADKVILLPIYPAREEPIPGVNSEMLLEGIGVEKVLLSKEELLEYLENE